MIHLSYGFVSLQILSKWANENDGSIAVILFILTLFLGWTSGIFSALQKKPKFRIRVIDGPTFLSTVGTGKKHNNSHVHRTCIAIYLHVSNIGSASSSIDSVEIGYHWAISPFSIEWIRFGIGHFWLKNQSVALEDFQATIGDKIKFFPFLFQKSGVSGESSETFLEIGRSTNGIVYFEQSDSYGACFPASTNNQVRIKICLRDTAGRGHVRSAIVNRVSLEKARLYNPSFGLTLTSLHGSDDLFNLPLDGHGNPILEVK